MTIFGDPIIPLFQVILVSHVFLPFTHITFSNQQISGSATFLIFFRIQFTKIINVQKIIQLQDFQFCQMFSQKSGNFSDDGYQVDFHVFIQCCLITYTEVIDF